MSRGRHPARGGEGPATWSRITMADVAREAQVSNATVSRFLDGVVPVSDETKAKVLAAIQKTGYIRNEAASRLARGTSDTVGLVLRDPSNPYYGRLHVEVLLHTAERRLHLLTVAAPLRYAVSGTESPALRRLLEQRVGGILVASGGISPQDLVPLVSDVPTVVLGRPEEHPSLNTVSHDEVANGHLIADQVLACGHREVAVVVPADDPVVLVERRRGAAMAERLRDGGARARVIEHRSTVPDDLRDTDRTLIDLVRGGAVTAVMFAGDLRLIAFLKAAQEAGLRVPEDVSATGVDGVLPGLDLLGLATVRLPIETLARRGMEILSEHMSDDGPQPVRHEFYTGTFVPGRTLAQRT